MGWGEPIGSSMTTAAITVSCRVRNELAYVLGFIEATPLVNTAAFSLLTGRIDALGIPAYFDPEVEPEYPSLQARDVGRPERLAMAHLAAIHREISNPLSVAFIEAIQKARIFLDMIG